MESDAWRPGAVSRQESSLYRGFAISIDSGVTFLLEKRSPNVFGWRAGATPILRRFTPAILGALVSASFDGYWIVSTSMGALVCTLAGCVAATSV